MYILFVNSTWPVCKGNQLADPPSLPPTQPPVARRPALGPTTLGPMHTDQGLYADNYLRHCGVNEYDGPEVTYVHCTMAQMYQFRAWKYCLKYIYHSVFPCMCSHQLHYIET